MVSISSFLGVEGALSFGTLPFFGVEGTLRSGTSFLRGRRGIALWNFTTFLRGRGGIALWNFVFAV